ncbi:hypothetical protein PoB_002293300 [Plakobranchus ocellatus]|uniref:Uncharacterized protein n=1 Tax=Plakobranchus ocellatus TaxID=259542 RepID=A0AAV3ZPP2_9GAST|nr:hypothetical protein PoB_002293300 [Plakobranchus ocellatus]
MFLSDPVNIWFRRRSSGSCEDAHSIGFPERLACGSPEIVDLHTDDATDCAVFTSPPTSADTSLAPSPSLRARSGSSPTPSSSRQQTKDKTKLGSLVDKTSKRSSGSKNEQTGEEKVKRKGPRMLWRSKSSCSDPKFVEWKSNYWRGKYDDLKSSLHPQNRDLLPTPRPVIRQKTTPIISHTREDCPHQLDPSLGNIEELYLSLGNVQEPCRASTCIPPSSPLSYMSSAASLNHQSYRSSSASLSPPNSYIDTPSSPMSPPCPLPRTHPHCSYHSYLSPTHPVDCHTFVPPTRDSGRRRSSLFLSRSSCFDFECISDKLRSLQGEWRANKQQKRRLSRQEAKVTKEENNSYKSSRSSSRSCSRSPRTASPMSCNSYLNSTEGKV